jgi:two-component system response regulator AtoC
MNGDRPHILIVDDEPNMRLVLSTLFEQNDFVAKSAQSAEEALAHVRDHDPDLILTDMQMPGMGGLELLRTLNSRFPEIPVVLLTAYGTVSAAVEAMRRGAFDFLLKPFDRDQLVEVARKAVAHARRTRLGVRESPESGAGQLLGESEPMVQLRLIIDKVARSPATVLIRGETGTGKELVANAIHAGSSRSDQPLIAVNCGALPESLVESELFGHKKGAFTGAADDRIGRFKLADGGTLFLDEIGELPLASQVKILRALEDGETMPVGGTQTERVDVRLIAATHRDLERAVRDGEFREDLYFRLKVVQLQVPPLRDRIEDIPALVECFIDKHSTRLERPRFGVTPETLDALMSRPWPGNVRELANTLERAVLLAETDPLTPFDLGLADAAPKPPSGGSMQRASRSAAAAVERRMIRAALDLTRGNVTHAAERLGLSRRGLQNKMKELGLRDSLD